MKEQQQLSVSNPGPRFVRRRDLTPVIRLYIGITALLAQQQKQWGVITQLAREYLISRTFVYLLAFQVGRAGEVLFADRVNAELPVEERLPYVYLLSLRLEGCCSLNAMSTMMARFGLRWSSVGKLSQSLHAMGGLIHNTIATPDETIRLMVFASDELFAGMQPILLTVEPQSSVILRIELTDTRQWEDWKRHWECLYDNGCHALYLVCDGGQALAKAHEESLEDVMLQPDTYHALAHALGPWKIRLEKRAYAAITVEYDRLEKLDSARSEAVITSRIEQYEQACRHADEAIAHVDEVAYLYHELHEQLSMFDETGRLRDRTKAQEQMMTALELLDTLEVESLSKAVAKTRRTLPQLLNYFDIARTRVPALIRELPIAPTTLRLLCRAHHWRKRLITARTPETRQHCEAQERNLLDRAAKDGRYTGESKAHVYEQLDQIVQSSSMVECINSILRPYLDMSRNQVSQEFLNLLMFYHNHRRYRAGKRAKHTPMELFTGQPQRADWLELLCEEIEAKQPGFFAMSH